MGRYLKRAMRERYAEINNELSLSSCRLRAARRHQRKPDPELGVPVSTLALCPGGLWTYPPCELPEVSLAWLPFVRFPLGAHLLLQSAAWDRSALDGYLVPLPPGPD